MAQIQLHHHESQSIVDSANATKRSRGFHPFGEDGLTFGDVLDLINPLQHIPVIGALYRKITGDVIDPAIRIAGGALFGGPIGAAVASVAVAVGAVRHDPASPRATQTAERFEQPVKPAAMVSKPRRSTVAATAFDGIPDRAATGEIQTTALELAQDPGRTLRHGRRTLADAYGAHVEKMLESASIHRSGRVDVAV